MHLNIVSSALHALPYVIQRFLAFSSRKQNDLKEDNPMFSSLAKAV